MCFFWVLKEPSDTLAWTAMGTKCLLKIRTTWLPSGPKLYLPSTRGERSNTLPGKRHDHLDGPCECLLRRTESGSEEEASEQAFLSLQRWPRLVFGSYRESSFPRSGFPTASGRRFTLPGWKKSFPLGHCPDSI